MLVIKTGTPAYPPGGSVRLWRRSVSRVHGLTSRDGWYWVFKTQTETKEQTGEGVGGVLGLVVWILIGAVSAFLIPSEIGRMYERDGRAAPINGWSGLWLFPGRILIVPAIVWFVKVQGALNRFWSAKAVAGYSGS